MTVHVVKRQGLDDAEVVAVWEPDEGFVEGDDTFTDDDVYEKYDQQMLIEEFDGPDLFAVPADMEKAMTAGRMADDAFDSLEKEWVKDPSEEASTMRWFNTETGEYRYQESKPGEEAAGQEEPGRPPTEDVEGGSDDPIPVDELEPGQEAIINGERVTIDGVTEDQGGPIIEYTVQDTGEEQAIYAEFLSGVEEGGDDEEELSPSERFEEEFHEVGDGEYARVDDIDPFVNDTHPEEGDTLLLDNGRAVEAAGGVVMGPDREHYQVVKYGGSEMHIQLDNVEGVAGTIYETGEYDVQNEWGAKFANGLETGEFTERGADGFVGVRDIQHHASDVDNPELLGDMVDAERDGRGSQNAISAMKGRIRALGEDPSDYITDPDPGEAATFSAEAHEEWQEQYSPDAVADSTPLSDFTDAEPGVSAKYMKVQKLEDGTGVFRTDYRANGQDGIKTRYRDEILAAHEFAQNIGMEEHVPPIEVGENGEYIAMREFGGEVDTEEVSNVPSEWKEDVDGDEVLDQFGAMMLFGAGDLHSNNVMVSENGELGFHDLDHAFRQLHEGGSYSAAGSGSKTVLKLLNDRDHEELPDDLRERIPEDDWNGQDPWDRAWDHSFRDTVRDVISERTQAKAAELLSDGGRAEDYVGEPPENFPNKVGNNNDIITDNIRTAAKDYNGGN